MNSGVYIGSSGIKRISEMTIESYYAIKNADIVIVLDNSNETLNFLDAESVSYKNITKLYKENIGSKKIYEELSDIIIKNYDKNSVLFLTDGNPMFMNSISNYLSKKCLDKNIPFITFCGVSTLDKFFDEFEVLLDSLSVEIVKPNTIFNKKNSSADIVLVMQPSDINSDSVSYNDIPNLQNCKNFIKFCQDILPAGGEIFLYQSSIHPNDSSSIVLFADTDDFYRSMSKSTLILDKTGRLSKCIK